MDISTIKIESLIAAQGITKKELSARSGISRQSLSTIVRRGTCAPITAGKLARGLSVDVTDILENSKGG
ncbi:helix-turn-helix domain-containing protein [Butyricicoccus porcorum]|uniref:helix-turn-helix domain-containing protein n=1 Tax=Butyricicoccus porcorum TaxID=1945634 RepID=UPI003F4A868A